MQSARIEDQKFRRLRRGSNVGLPTAHGNAHQFRIPQLFDARRSLVPFGNEREERYLIVACTVITDVPEAVSFGPTGRRQALMPVARIGERQFRQLRRASDFRLQTSQWSPLLGSSIGCGGS